MESFFSHSTLNEVWKGGRSILGLGKALFVLFALVIEVLRTYIQKNTDHKNAARLKTKNARGTSTLPGQETVLGLAEFSTLQLPV